MGPDRFTPYNPPWWVYGHGATFQSSRVGVWCGCVRAGRWWERRGAPCAGRRRRSAAAHAARCPPVPSDNSPSALRRAAPRTPATETPPHSTSVNRHFALKSRTLLPAFLSCLQTGVSHCLRTWRRDPETKKSVGVGAKVRVRVPSRFDGDRTHTPTHKFSVETDRAPGECTPPTIQSSLGVGFEIMVRHCNRAPHDCERPEWGRNLTGSVRV